MKAKVLVIVIALLGLGACTQKTCPTYAKQDVKDGLKTEQVKV